MAEIKDCFVVFFVIFVCVKCIIDNKKMKGEL